MTEPFLKWAGGKRWLSASKQLPLPASFSRYVEPFLGGGAVFFQLKPARALLSDVNPELIELYVTFRDNYAALEQAMIAHQANHTEENYYKVRSEIPNDPVARAARTLYLNRTCWNGLYRVNLKGEFNVPIGTKTKVVDSNEDFAAISKTLSHAEIRNSDFENIIDETVEGDFAFIDPPYTVQHNMNGFVKYNEKLFSWNDQVRLRDAVVRAAGRGVAIVLTNADHASVHALYADEFRYQTLNRASVLAGLKGRRGPTTEAMFLANMPAIEPSLSGDMYQTSACPR